MGDLNRNNNIYKKYNKFHESIKKESRVKTRFLKPSSNPGLESGVTDNVMIMDFSP